MAAGLMIVRLNNPTLNYMTIALSIVTTLIFIFLYLFGFALLLWNAYVVWQKESHTLANMLTLFIGLAIIDSFFIPTITRLLHIPTDVNRFLGTIISVFLLYLPIFFYLYLSSLFIYQFNRPRYRQDYIIVLGSGLIDGERVSPLLASRIDRAIHFYRKQVSKHRPAPKLVFSGGQGPDEKLSEAVAMQQYAIIHGIPAAQTLTEEKSLNTLQNMQFSKALIMADSNKTAPKIIFATNNYHTFRAGLFAKQAGLKADGIGAKTSHYFLPNAIIREFIAILKMKHHQFILVAITSIILAFINVLFSHQ
ncbi:hypothetical protein FC90_GL000202 [Latilactobacillus graminis DSM 20719]|uniref:DUF218 domain-containing protein n=2 Tax=Latilactobacillus graminis TaxID=60519 RepID=A0AA89L1M4_9LACO|nr:hypothetical protein FC90_GL000202 [Latilactobacillus graminis DSM 20719]